MTMKRLSIILGLILAAGLMLSHIELSAQDSTKAGSPAMQANHGANFVDENGNGICDRFEQGRPAGSADHRMGGHGQNFIDENGDGICDHAGAGGQNHGRRGNENHRMGNGHRSGR
jgi:hypothetical protein